MMQHNCGTEIVRMFKAQPEIYCHKSQSHQASSLSKSLPPLNNSHKPHPQHPCKCLFVNVNYHLRQGKQIKAFDKRNRKGRA